ncbi:MAG TPA: hypothetical protein VMU28_15670 [Terriglobales bacterium]|nr:hypothetical protein [Terriglobales bacterium]
MSQGSRWKRIRVLWIGLALGTMLSACSISTQKESNGEDKKVDIKTPFAEIHVGSDITAQDGGFALYPGAHPKQEDNDKHRANIQIGGKDFGVKVIAVTYLSDDPPQKVIDFYRKDLSKFGKVLECPKGLKENHGNHESQLSCDDNGSTEPGKLDLAVGVPEKQHVVAVKPNGKGTEFSTVFVQVKGDKDQQTM